MDQYLSTYTKDYMWPDLKKNNSVRNTEEAELDEKEEWDRCLCGAEPGGYMPPREYTTTSVGDDYRWSRLDPMGLLPDRMLYPAKMGVPEFDVMQYEQPDTYLKKLEEKYPYLYGVLHNAPAEDMMRRVDMDRMRTTYQIDYGHIDEHPSAEYDKLLANARFSADCSRSAIVDCRMHIRPPNYSTHSQEQFATNGSGGFGGLEKSRDVANGRGDAKTGTGKDFSKAGTGKDGSKAGTGRDDSKTETGRDDSKAGTGKSGRSLAVKAMRRNGGKKSDEGGFSVPDNEQPKRPGQLVDDPEAANKPLPAWTSEYQEIIGQTGLDIVMDKIHQHGGRSPGRIFMERAVMHCCSRAK